MYFLYNIGIFIATQVLRILSLFNSKIKLFVEGRKESFRRLEEAIGPDDKTFWFHCASLGEFEQGRPVIEKLAERHPGHKIVLTFFSPSGYEVQKDYSLADVVVYLPLDSRRNAKRFLDLVHPSLSVFVKYEFWPNLLREIQKRKLPAFLISAIFREQQIFFKPQGAWMRSALKAFSHFFVQNSGSKDLLNKIGFEEVTISGDTRFDRVQAILGQNNALDFLEDFVKNRTVVVAGSTWPRDEELLTDFINSNDDDELAFVIAPHHMDPERFEKLQKRIEKDSLLYSEGTPGPSIKAFIIDTIGLLTKIYSYADVAVVGGGFDKEGIHNVLEPAVFGTPIVIGPVFDRYQEAVDLVERKGCLVAHDQNEFNKHLTTLLSDEQFRLQTGMLCKDFILENTGSTEIIVNFLDQKV